MYSESRVKRCGPRGYLFPIIFSAVFEGQHPADETPTLSTLEPAPVSAALSLTLPPLSITVLDFDMTP